MCMATCAQLAHTRRDVTRCGTILNCIFCSLPHMYAVIWWKISARLEEECALEMTFSIRVNSKNFDPFAICFLYFVSNRKNSHVHGWTVDFAKGTRLTLSIPTTTENSMHTIEFVQAMWSRYYIHAQYYIKVNQQIPLFNVYFVLSGMWDSGHHPAIECIGHTDDDHCILGDE